MQKINGILKKVCQEDLELLKNNPDEFWKDVKVINYDAFNNCKTLEKIVIPDNIISIGKNAFAGCTSLKEVVMSKNMKCIEEAVFYGCESLEKVVLNEGLEGISEEAFHKCRKLKYIQLPKSLKYLGEYCFHGCENIEKVFISDNVTNIENGAFSGCTSLKEVEGANGVKIVQRSAFSSCKALEKIDFTDNLIYIEDRAFYSCESLTRIGKTKGIKHIGVSSFENCHKLEMMPKSNALDSIGDSAFKNCYQLTNVEIPQTLKYLGRNAFCECKGLKKMLFNASFQGINGDVLSGSGITEVEINGEIRDVYDYTFDFNKLKYLVITKDEKIKFVDNIEDVETFKYVLLLEDIFSVFPGINLGIIISNKKNIRYIIENITKLKNIKVKISGTDIDDFEDLKKCFERDYKLMKSIVKLVPSYVNEVNFIELYKLASCIGVLENKDIFIKINDKNIPVREYAYTILQGIFFREYIKFDELHIYLQGLTESQYNEEFLKFIADKTNLRDMCKEEKLQNGFIVRTYEWFQNRKKLIIEEDECVMDSLPKKEEDRYKIRAYVTTNSGIDKIKWKVPNVALLKKEFGRTRFTGVTTQRSRELAEYLNSFNLYEQKHFDMALQIDEKRIKDGINDHITKEIVKEESVDCLEDYKNRTNNIKKEIESDLTEIVKNQTDGASTLFTYEMLAKSDKANFAMGILTSCCATLYGAGGGAQAAMILDPDMQPLVVKNANGGIVSFGIIYVNRKEGYAVVNNFEVHKAYSDLTEEIHHKAMKGIDAFVKQYNKENVDKPIKIVTCGLSPNWRALNEYIQKNPESILLDAPNFNDFKYIGTGSWKGDWFKSQYIIWCSDDDLKNQLIKNKSK